MKKTKTLLATVMGSFLLGSLAFAQNANAQSSVTLYGVVDASMMYTSHAQGATGQNAGAQFSMTDSGMTASRWGLRGTEDLGSGLKAEFNLENGFLVNNGGYGNSNDNFFGRQAWVGLDSPYGSLKAGLQYSPFLISIFTSDPRGFSYFGSGLVNYVDNVLDTGLFNSNAITYTSPEIAGLQFSGLYALGGTPGDFQAGKQYSASLQYRYKGLTLRGALYSGNAGGSAASTPVPSTIAFVGRMLSANYRFDNSLSLGVQYVLYKVAGSFDNRVYSGGASYFVLPNLSVDAGVYYTRDGNDGANHSLLAAGGLEYYLSKRTTLYGQVGYVNNHGQMDTGLAVNNALYEVGGSTVGANVGIRHSF